MTEISTTPTHTIKLKLNELLVGSSQSHHAAVTSQVPARVNFKRSNTCGSFFAKCQCREPHREASKSLSLDATSPSVPSILISEESEQVDCDNKVVRKESEVSIAESVDTAGRSQSKSSSSLRSKQHPSFTHPDTPVIFTEENRYPDPSTTAALVGRRASREILIDDGKQKIEVKHSKRASSPNIIDTAADSFSSYDIHPEFKLQVVPKSPTFNDISSCGSHQHSHFFQHFHHQHNHLNHHRKPCLLKKHYTSKSKSFPSVVSSSSCRTSSSSLHQHSFDSDTTFSSYSVDEESEDAELNEKVSQLLTTDLDESSTSLSSSTHSSKSTTIETAAQRQSTSGVQGVQHISAEKYFQVG